MIHSEKQIEQLVAGYLSGTATAEEVSELTSWVQENAENQCHYEQLYNLWHMANPAFNLNDEDTERARIKVMQKLSGKRWYRVAFRYWERIAALLVIPLLILFFYATKDRERVYTKSAYQEISVPFGVHSRISLPDGSVAWLNAGSTLKYPVEFRKGERCVTLSGEAFFEVESDRENPFIVKTEYLDVTATGTAFNVEAYDKEPIAVTMVKGKVDVMFDDKENTVFLKPGDRMSYDIHTSSSQIVKTDPYKWYAWKDGNMVFRDDSLAYIFKKLGQTFNVDILLKDPDIGGQPYRVTFEDESLSVILDLLKLTAPIQYKVYEPKNISGNQYEKKRIEVYSIDKKQNDF